MKRLWLVAVMLAFGLVGTLQAGATGRLSLHADYNVPISTNSIGSNVEFGAQYRFWGIFNFNSSVFTNINYGADNIFNIASITPAGLFSVGLGMRIPLGGFGLELGWSRFYTGFGDNAGVYHFSDAFNIGIGIDLSDRFGIRVYSRSLYSFTPQSLTSSRYSTAASLKQVSTLGAGVVFHLP